MVVRPMEAYMQPLYLNDGMDPCSHPYSSLLGHIHAAPMQLLYLNDGGDPCSYSTGPPYSHFTRMMVGTHAAIHAAPNTVPCSPSQSLYLNGCGDPMQPSMQSPGSHFTWMAVQIHTANLAHTVPHNPLKPLYSPTQSHAVALFE